MGLVQSVRISASYSPIPPPEYLLYAGENFQNYLFCLTFEGSPCDIFASSISISIRGREGEEGREGQVGLVQSVRISASYSPIPPPEYLLYAGKNFQNYLFCPSFEGSPCDIFASSREGGSEGQVGLVQSVRISASYSPIPPPEYLLLAGNYI